MENVYIHTTFHLIATFSRLFYYILLFTYLFYFTYLCAMEVWNKTYFIEQREQIKSRETFWENTEPSSIYKPVNFLADVIIVSINFKKYLTFLPNFIFLLLLFKALYYLPGVYLILFQFYVFKRISTLSYWYIFNLNKSMRNPDFSFKTRCSFYNLLLLLIKLPDFWAFLMLYTIPFVRNKVRLKDLDRIGFNLIFIKPLWFLKLLSSLSAIVVEFFTSGALKRKVWWIWPSVVWGAVLEEVSQLVVENQKKTYPLIANRRIIMKNRTITLNPMSQDFFDFLKKNGSTGINSFNVGKVITLKKIPHQLFSRSDFVTNGFIMTTSTDVTLNGRSFTSVFLGLDNPKQRIFFSSHSLDIINPKFRYLRSFFRNNINNFDDYFMLEMRLNIINKIQTSQDLIVQQRGGHLIYPLSKNLTYSQIYATLPSSLDALPSHIKYIKSLNADYENLNRLKIELDDMNNLDLYNNYCLALSEAGFYTQLFSAHERRDLKNSYSSIKNNENFL